MSSVWNFLSTPWGMLVLLVIGLGLISYSLFRPKKAKITDIGRGTQEQLEFYKWQKENWRSNLRLNIKDIKLAIDGQVPKIIFGMEMINFLPIEIKLVKVVKSSGSVSVGALGSCALPFLPETIDEKIDKCSEIPFQLEMEVGGTEVPGFLKPKITEWGQQLQWTLKGEWYIEIDGKMENWKSVGEEIRFNQVIVR